MYKYKFCKTNTFYKNYVHSDQLYNLSSSMLDTNNDFGVDSSFDECFGNNELVNHEGSLEEWVATANVNNDIHETVLDSIDFTRIRLTTFRLLSRDEEHDLAMRLTKASEAIALLLLNWNDSKQELLQLLVVSTESSLSKNIFSNGEHYYDLRSELNHLVTTKGNPKPISHLLKLLREDGISNGLYSELPTTITRYIAQIDWSGPLMVALAKRHSHINRKSPSKLEYAIDELLRNLNSSVITSTITTKQDYQSLLERHITDYLTAREILVKHNLRLAFYVAKRYAQRPEHMVDLIQEGTLGLLRAAEKYRPATGYRFSTYAYQWIESKIRKARINIDRAITISPAYNSELGRLYQQMEDFQLKQTQTDTEDLNSIRQRFDTLVTLKKRSLSLDSQETNDGLSLHATIADPNADFFNDITSKHYADYMDSVMQSILTVRECYVINERFGRLDSDPKTLQELSDILNLSKERIRQLQQSALEKLTDYFTNRTELLNE